MTSETMPIGDYALLGDTRTAALVGTDGAIDWLCLPRFDGEPVFGSLIGGPAAGVFRMGPAEAAARVVDRQYLGATATLETTWSTTTGSLTLTEGMVAELGHRLLPTTLLVRRLTAHDGPVSAVVELDARLGEAHRPPRVRREGNRIVCSWGALAIAAEAEPALQLSVGERMAVEVEPGKPLTIVLAVAHREPLIHVPPAVAWAMLEDDQARWSRWCADIDTDLPHRALVTRSLLTLRLLTYSPSGAPVAAPTTSLPEEPGGSRNWDYRFAWPRDASIGVAAFLATGHADEARHFLAWLLHASRLQRPRLPVLLTLDGRHPRPERALRGWPGYLDSRPVRVGNAAAEQHQLDGYGWVLDAAWNLADAGHHLYRDTWRAMSSFADEVARRWRAPDAGIWETRGEPAHYVHSKLMGWLALDRAIRISMTHPTRPGRRRRWEDQRDAIAAEVCDRGYAPAVSSYTRTYGSTDLDAAVLVLPLLDLEPTESPRVRGTIDAIREELSAGGPLLYRYRRGDDGLPGPEGAFLPCSFWLVQALAATGRTAEATELFDELAALASPVGLYAEEMDPVTLAHLGNYPQALTHAALVQAALALRAARRSHSSRATTPDLRNRRLA